MIASYGLAEIENRIGTFYAPYHGSAPPARSAHERFAYVWHLNLHSMPSDSYELLDIDTDKTMSDFVLGDRDGHPPPHCAPRWSV